MKTVLFVLIWFYSPFVLSFYSPFIIIIYRSTLNVSLVNIIISHKHVKSEDIEHLKMWGTANSLDSSRTCRSNECGDRTAERGNHEIFARS